MAYNMTDEEFVEHLIRNPDYCMFYHRARIRQLLPSLAKAYRLVDGIQKELEKKNEDNKNVRGIRPENLEIFYNSVDGTVMLTIDSRRLNTNIYTVEPKERLSHMIKILVDEGYVFDDQVVKKLKKVFEFRGDI